MTETFTCHPVLTPKPNYEDSGTKEFGLWDMCFVSWFAHTKASNDSFQFNLWAKCVLYRIYELVERSVDAKIDVAIGAGPKSDGVSCSVSAERLPSTNTNPGQFSATLTVGINPAFGRPDDMVDIDVSWVTASSGGAVQVGITPGGHGGAGIALPNDDGSVNGYTGLFHWTPKKVVKKSGEPAGTTKPPGVVVPPPAPGVAVPTGSDPWAGVGAVFEDIAPPPPDTKTAKAPVKSFGVVLAASLALLGGNATTGDTTKPVAAQSPAPTTAPTTGPTAATGPAPSVSPSAPRFTGMYRGPISVKEDPHGHAQFIGKMPDGLDVRVTRNTETGDIMVNVVGARPFVPVSSTDKFDEATGDFTATGQGTVTDRNIKVTSTFEGTVNNGELTGTFTYTGTPNGPITYSVDMAR